MKELLVDDVALREHRVELHGAHDGTDVGQNQVHDGKLYVLDLVDGPLGVGYDEEGDGVNLDVGVVVADDLLLRHVNQLLLEVNPVGLAVDEGRNEIQAGLQRLLVASEPLDNDIKALGHDADPFGENHDDQGNQNSDNVHLVSLKFSAAKQAACTVQAAVSHISINA